MRLLIISDTFTPDVNGVARSLRQFAVGLESRGHHVSVVTTCDDAADHLPRHIVSSMALPGYSTVRLGIATRRWFVDLIHADKPDVLYVATETPLGIAALMAARQTSLPVVSGFHTNFHRYAREYHFQACQPAAESILRAFHNRTLRTVAPSNDTARQLREMGIHPVAVVGRGVNAELFAPHARSHSLRCQWGAGIHTPVAIYVGRVAAEKNLSLLERAFSAFLEEQPEGRCVVVGKGPMLDELERRHPGWIFAGERSDSDLAAHFASADVFIFPSMTETFGNVVIEALACGLVTVAYAYAAAAEHMRDGIEGLLAPLGDEKQFITKVRLAASRWDDDALRIMSRLKARQLSWAIQVERFEALLLQTISSLPALAAPP